MDGNRPAEIFGYPLANRSVQAQLARQQCQCPFRNVPCEKRNNPGMPAKDAFVDGLNHKLQLRLAAVGASRPNKPYAAGVSACD